MACSVLARSRCTFGARVVSASSKKTLRLVVRAELPKSVSKVVERVSPVAVTVAANIIMAMPAAAGGKLFDFNATLPAMVGEFLLLMVFLDKFWFGPVGKVLDERDALLREKLGSVKDNSSELGKLASEAEGILKAARSEVAANITSQKNTKQAELDKLYYAAKDKITKEVETSIAAVEKESQALLKTLDAQVDKVSGEVLKRVLPEGVKI